MYALAAADYLQHQTIFLSVCLCLCLFLFLFLAILLFYHLVICMASLDCSSYKYPHHTLSLAYPSLCITQLCSPLLPSRLLALPRQAWVPRGCRYVSIIVIVITKTVFPLALLVVLPTNPPKLVHLSTKPCLLHSTLLG